MIKARSQISFLSVLESPDDLTRLDACKRMACTIRQTKHVPTPLLVSNQRNMQQAVKMESSCSPALKRVHDGHFLIPS